MDPSGIFATRWSREYALVRTRWQWLWLAAFIVALVLVPLSGASVIALLSTIGITSIVVIGLQITTGLAGQINLGQAAFMGVGAYTTAVLAAHGTWPFWAAIPAGGCAAALFGFLFGLSAVRIKGFYLALTTIAAQFVFSFLILNLPATWLGGASGVNLQPAEVFGLRLESDTLLYFFILIFTIVMSFGAYGIARSRHGRAYMAVRDDDVASGIIGINVVRTKAVAFLVGAFYAGIGGGLWAYYVRYVSVDQFDLINSIWYVAMIIVGGMGSVTGAVIGVTVIELLRQLIAVGGAWVVSQYPGFDQDVVAALAYILLGVIIALFLIFEPRGLMYRWAIIKQSYRIWPYPY